MRFVSLASSSKGNSALISFKNTNILIDCGISKKRLVSELSIYDLSIRDIDAILISHEHEDHVLGLPAVLKDNAVKLISQRETLLNIATYCEHKGTKVNLDNFKIVHPINVENDGQAVVIKDIKIYPIKGSHDVPSIFYKIELGDIKVAIVTDVGNMTEYMIRSISDVNYLMLECNYDVDMMIDSARYPAFLKNRIMSDRGHLSNVQCSECIMKLMGQNVKKVFLSHISEETNSEDFAYEFVSKYLKDHYSDFEKLPEICVSKRLERTVIIDK